MAAGIRIGAPQPLFQRLIHVGPSQAEGRKNSRQNAGDDRNDGRKGKDLRIQPDFGRMGDLIRQEGHDQTDTGLSTGQAKGASNQREQDRLGENLTSNASRTGTQRSSNRDLLLAAESF